MLKSDLKQNAMNMITENLNCMGAVGPKRATLCRCIRCILVDINGETENCSVCESLKSQNIEEHANCTKYPGKKHKTYSCRNANEPR